MKIGRVEKKRKGEKEREKQSEFLKKWLENNRKCLKEITEEVRKKAQKEESKGTKTTTKKERKCPERKGENIECGKKTSEMMKKENIKEERNELTEKFRKVTGKVVKDCDKLGGVKKFNDEGIVKRLKRNFEQSGNGEGKTELKKREAEVKKKVAKFENLARNHEKCSEKDEGGPESEVKIPQEVPLGGRQKWGINL